MSLRCYHSARIGDRQFSSSIWPCALATPSTECATISFVSHPAKGSPTRIVSWTCADDCNEDEICRDAEKEIKKKVTDCTVTCCQEDLCNKPGKQGDYVYACVSQVKLGKV